MQVIELLGQVRDNLQDADADYWSDSELLNLYNEGKRYLAAERQENTTSKAVILIDDTHEYTVDGVLRYITAKDSDDVDRPIYPDDATGDDDINGIIIQDYNRIYVNNPTTDITLTLKVISFPSEDNLNTTIRSGDESAYKYYALAKAYEKESDMENFQKSSYFWSMFRDSITYIKKNANLNYIDKVQKTEGFYF